MTNDLKKSNVLILSHFYVRGVSSGPPQDLRDFLLSKVKNLVYIEHPFPYNLRYGEDTRSSITIYEYGLLKKRLYFPPWKGVDIFFYIKDVIATQWFLLIARKRFDFCVALDNLNTFSVLPWRKLGLIRKLVYYTIDFAPVRFENHLLNFIYHRIDRICCYHTDFIWNVSERFMEGRRQRGVDIKRSAPSIIAPMGAHLSRIKRMPVEQTDRHTIAFVGHLLQKQGLQLVLKVLPYIRKEVPDVKLVIVGKGEYMSELQGLAKQLGIKDIVNFKGFVKDHHDVERILCRCSMGMAPYVPRKASYTFYADPGKPKLYLGCGLPVVITRVPAIAIEIEKHGAGIIIEYNKESLKQALMKLLTDDDFYIDCRKKAIAFSKMFDTEHILNNTLEKTLFSSAN